MCRVTKHIQVRKLVGGLPPERLQHGCGVPPSIGEKIAKTEQIAGLHRVRLLPDHGFESRNCFEKCILTVISKANIQPYAGELRRQALRRLKRTDRLAPLLA